MGKNTATTLAAYFLDQFNRQSDWSSPITYNLFYLFFRAVLLKVPFFPSSNGATGAKNSTSGSHFDTTTARFYASKSTKRRGSQIM
jgi:hypothetical protein